MKKILIVLAIVLSFTISSFLGAVAYADVASDSVYLGGTPLGVIVKADGLIIQDTCSVNTDKGEVYPARAAGILPNDILISIDNMKMKEISDINKIISKSKNTTHSLLVKRKNEEIKFNVRAEKDKIYKENKLGLIIKNDIAGVGTLTYVRADNMRFGGLGHQIFNENEPNKDLYTLGLLFNCNVIGVIKGEKGKAGELKGIFSRSDNPIGRIDKNTFSGIFGFGQNELIASRPLIKLGNKNNVTSGKAYIYTTINGNVPQKYEIEIVKVAKQNSPEPKSMVIEITDERLICESNGIVQGMSGSPIIQNGMLIGAVTHVLLSNPQKGYGIFVDWMINN